MESCKTNGQFILKKTDYFVCVLCLCVGVVGSSSLTSVCYVHKQEDVSRCCGSESHLSSGFFEMTTLGK